ncbi:hypothetical protein PFAG_05896 [Plasmodium falciparum Santa Lucia]|uniref:Surface antigen n=1 Tax=Plasmodium falciparum Santa Lucia TaxID=478859 RepID=W7FNF3_PLAFA|nr:hypothetical protein PFAG_05896 [Plasmodium falciparum Santa Lucia]
MKFNYTNILLFSFLLNILLLSSQVYIQWNDYNTCQIQITKLTTTNTRLLCECNVYTCIYDSDPEMKAVMHDFDRQTSQRFREYDERMIKNRQKCKEQCQKDIQKIILKDKIEKELTEKLSAMQTDITTDDIPTCACEKSLADKVEKTCLKCGGVLGSGVPGLGLIGGVTTYFQFLDAITAAIEAGKAAGINKAVAELGNIYYLHEVTVFNWIAKVNEATYDKANSLFAILKEIGDMCEVGNAVDDSTFCVAKLSMQSKQNQFVKIISQKATQAAADASLEATTVTKVGEDAASATSTIVSNFFTNPIGISIIVIIIIVVLLLIIYLILRYRRKKKMKKKLQYIKLLKN